MDFIRIEEGFKEDKDAVRENSGLVPLIVTPCSMKTPSSNRTLGANKEFLSLPLLVAISANNRIVLNMTADRVRRNRCLLRCKSAVATQSPISPPMARHPTGPRCVFPPGILDLRMRESDNMGLGSYISIDA
jgi:hypothetical protein